MPKPTHACMYARTQARMHARAHTHTYAHTLTLTHTLSFTHAHTTSFEQELPRMACITICAKFHILSYFSWMRHTTRSTRVQHGEDPKGRRVLGYSQKTQTLMVWSSLPVQKLVPASVPGLNTCASMHEKATEHLCWKFNVCLHVYEPCVGCMPRISA
jgi:hypothetical protein